MFHHATFVTTSQHHRDRLVERAAALIGERPRAVCRPLRSRAARAARNLAFAATGARRS